MKRFALPMVVTTLITGLGLFWTQSPKAADDKPDDVRTFMHAKLEHSKHILEGLATEDFALIARDGQQLTLLSLEADWNVIQTAEYQQHSLAFRKTSQTLTDAAQKKNLDGATLAFVDMTLKCVQCHKYVRSVEVAGLDRPAGPLLPEPGRLTQSF